MIKWVTNFLLRSNVSPCQLLLKFISLVSLLSGFGCFLEARHDLFIVCLEVWDCFLLAHENLRSLGDVFEACFVLFTQLTKLGATKEELRVRETLRVQLKDSLTLYLSEGWEELKNCLAASEWAPSVDVTTNDNQVLDLPCVRTFIGLSTWMFIWSHIEESSSRLVETNLPSLLLILYDVDPSLVKWRVMTILSP